MRISFEWLKDYIKLEASPQEVSERLTMIGHEVEAVEELADDIVMEVNVTPNRSDCLSIFGLARELSASYGIPLKFPEHQFAAESGQLDFNIDILDPDLCNRYAGRIVKNVEIGPSPEWMKKRLEKCGIRSINNIVDITNYVLLELGHPLHAFDLRTLKGNCIRIGTPKTVKGNGIAVKTKTLDGAERPMHDDSLLIWDAEDSIAIAGVMGGLDTEVKSDTKDIFIESAYFDPISIRKTSKALGLKTESSYRFERGSDIKMLKKALDRAVFLMKKYGGGQIYGKIDIYPKIFYPPEINLKYEKVNSFLGLKLSREDVIKYLKCLGLEIEEMPDYVKVKPPSFRRDIRRDSDLIEEIARMYGYDRIPIDLPKASICFDDPENKTLTQRNKAKDAVRISFLKNGCTEAVNFSFMGAEDLDLLMLADGDERRKATKVMNPLRIEDSYMRTTLIPSLIKNILHNIAHGNKDLRLFEISKVFIGNKSFMENIDPQDAKLPDERLHIAAICYTEKAKTLYGDTTHEFYLIKGIVEAEFKSLKINNYSFKRSSEPFLHPGQSADVFVSDTKIGFIGMLAPSVISKLDMKAFKPQIAVAELNLDTLTACASQALVYVPLSRFPYIERDTAVILDSSVESSLIIKLARAYPSDLIEDAYIFDVYQGGSISEGKKSIAFNIRYRAADRTLKDEEVDILHKSLVEFILHQTKGLLRA